MAARLPLKIGSSDAKGDDVTHWQRWALKYAASYAPLLMGPVDGYYGTSDGAFTYELKRRLIAAGHSVVLNTIFDQATADIVKYKGASTSAGTGMWWRKGAWIYTMPGSGADWTIGPAFQVGIHAEARHGFRHQGVQFAQGGYLGLMGGDSSLSFNESNLDMIKSLEWLLDHNPDVQALMAQLNAGQRATVDLDLIFVAYSKSAIGLSQALVKLFGDGGKYAKIRGWIRLVIQFGDPGKSEHKDGGSPGWNPGGSGIARVEWPAWLLDKTVSITNPLDFYAVVPLNELIRPVFYQEIIDADAQLPYFAHLLNIGVGVAMEWLPLFAPLLGGLTSGIGIPIIGGMAKLPASSFGELTKMFGFAGNAHDDTNVDAELIKMFSAQGLFTTMPQLIGVIGALPGLQNHGMYHVPFPELGNRSGIQVGCDLVNLFVAGRL